MPQVSIVILNYNTFNLTCKCIDSVYKQTKGVSFEIILVDNGSVEVNAGLFSQQFPSIQLIKSDTNLGFSKGNNLAINKAKGEIILLLNSDTELIEDSITFCYNELINNSEVGVVTCKLIYPNSVVQHNCQSFPSVLKILLEKTRLHKLLSKTFRARYLQGFYWDYEMSGYPDWVWGTFFMFKKSLLNKLPNKQLNDLYFMYVEDMKWCLDISNLKYRIKYLALTKIIHHIGASEAKTNELVLKNQLHFIRTNYSRIKVWFIIYLN